MASKKQPPKDTAAEEIDLTAIDIDAINIPLDTTVKTASKESKP
jgi:hypothetical protein